MKKLIILTAVLIISGAGFAQAGLGLRFGLNYSKLTNRPFYSSESNNIKPKMVPGIAFGLVGDIAVTDIFFLQMELNYAEMGTSYELPASLPGLESSQSNSETGTLTRKYNTFQIPLVAKFTTYDTKVTWYFETGFFWSYFIDGEYTMTSSNNTLNEKEEINFNEFKREDFGFVVGLGFGTKLGKKMSWALNLRYNRGVTELFTDSMNTFNGYVPTTTRSLSISLILMIL